jgi:hypothetical protein
MSYLVRVEKLAHFKLKGRVVLNRLFYESKTAECNETLFTFTIT